MPVGSACLHAGGSGCLCLLMGSASHSCPLMGSTGCLCPLIGSASYPCTLMGNIGYPCPLMGGTGYPCPLMDSAHWGLVLLAAFSKILKVTRHCCLRKSIHIGHFFSCHTPCANNVLIFDIMSDKVSHINWLKWDIFYFMLDMSHVARIFGEQCHRAAGRSLK